MNFETLEFEKVDTNIGVLKINRPQAMNALNNQVIKELKNFCESITSDKDIRCLILTGAGEKSFVAGADIKEMQELDSTSANQLSRTGQQVFSAFENLPFPTIACVNGFALGGGMELAMSCDFIFASSKAKFGLPEVSLGLIPGYGGTQRLQRLIGIQKAKLVALTGDMFSAEKCKNWGVVAEVFEPEVLMDETMKVAKTIASRAPLALEKTKQAIYQGRDMSIEDGLRLEAEKFSFIFNTKDHNEGISAFIEKRKAHFQGE